MLACLVVKWCKWSHDITSYNHLTTIKAREGGGGVTVVLASLGQLRLQPLLRENDGVDWWSNGSGQTVVVKRWWSNDSGRTIVVKRWWSNDSGQTMVVK